MSRRVSKSVTEEAIGILWAILASLTASTVIAVVAWVMAGVSLAAALYFAVAERRAQDQAGSHE